MSRGSSTFLRDGFISFSLFLFIYLVFSFIFILFGLGDEIHLRREVRNPFVVKSNIIKQKQVANNRYWSIAIDFFCLFLDLFYFTFIHVLTKIFKKKFQSLDTETPKKVKTNQMNSVSSQKSQTTLLQFFQKQPFPSKNVYFLFFLFLNFMSFKYALSKVFWWQKLSYLTCIWDNMIQKGRLDLHSCVSWVSFSH